MVNDFEKQDDIQNLLVRFIESDLDDEQRERLLTWSRSDPKAFEVYYDFMRDYAIISRQVAGHIQSASFFPEDCPYDHSFWEAFQEAELTSPTVEIEKPMPEWKPVELLKIEKSPRTINKFSLYSAIVSIAALVFVLIFIRFAPPAASSVATIADSLDAQWGKGQHSTAIGDQLWNNEGPRWLKEGTVKIVFDYGAEVILEGPVEFELVSANQMQLHSGRLYAIVPERATGFIVHTPYATVIDQGTEFGVKVDFDGSSDVHMFKGKALLVPGSDGDKKASVGLAAGQAKMVTQSGWVSDIEFKKQMFVRRIDSQKGFLLRGTSLDLTDLINNGNGFGTGTPGKHIDLGTGQIKLLENSDIQYSDNMYHPCMELPFVDGVFVPDRESVPVQISSQGHLWKDCPDTSGRFAEGIYTGENDQYPIPRGSDFDQQRNGTDAYPAMMMYINAGVTFDLAAIRDSLPPEVKIVRFEAMCGVSQLANTQTARVGFSVLIDGENRFETKTRKSSSEPTRIVVELGQDDLFLTLASHELDLQWGNRSFFAKPRLILE